MCLSNRPKVSYKVSSDKIMGEKMRAHTKETQEKTRQLFFLPRQ